MLMCMECVYVVGGCNVACSHEEGCSWLAVVHDYEVSFIPTECFIRKKLMFRLLVCSLHQSIHSMHKTLLYVHVVIVLSIAYPWTH